MVAKEVQVIEVKVALLARAWIEIRWLVQSPKTPFRRSPCESVD